MTGYTNDFNELIKQQVARKQLEDFDDLQHAVADIDVGRQRRHLTNPNERDGAKARKKREASELIQRTLVWLLENDREYARLHRETMRRLAKAEQLIEAAIIDSVSALEKAQSQLENTLNRAARTADGTRVFRDAEGRVWTENGVQVDSKTEVELHWTGAEPSWEEFVAHRDHAHELEKTIGRRRHIQTDVLGKARDRLMDNENPVSESEMEDLLQEIDDAIQSELPDVKPSDEAQVSPAEAKGSAIPDMGKRN